MIVLNGGSYYPDSKEVDEFWISKISKGDIVAFIPAATTRSKDTYFEFFRTKMEVYGLTNLISIDLYSEWKSIHDANAIYIAGGNTFKLIDIMRKSGFSDFLLKNWTKLILIGNSAGAVVLGRDIRTANDSDHIEATQASGLGLVDFSICPHYSEDKRARLESKSILLQHRVVGIPEQSAIVVTDKEIHFGQIQSFCIKRGILEIV